jgi:hypothetical protein
MINRRDFISLSALATAGWFIADRLAICSGALPVAETIGRHSNVYGLFRDPPVNCRPFVRWWWNGNKVEKSELLRELHVLKDAGIGGVEINPVRFPTRSEGDDLGIPSLFWLGDEWTDLLKVVFAETKSLGMTCDLIAGSGWPFGAEDIPENERSQIVVIFVRKVTGPLDFSISKEEIFNESDPPVSSPWKGRKFELLSLSLVPDPVSSVDQIADLSDLAANDYIDFFVPEGNHAIYALVRINGFMEVINGAPGASGPVLDHFNDEAVSKFLWHMSDTISARTGPLSQHLRALFTDSMELEGANWTGDMQKEFIHRRGYDIVPFLPFVLFRTGAMGNVTDYKYGAAYGTEFDDMMRRMRYDFETTKAEILEQRFLAIFASWCRGLGVKSRMQAYGRGFFPLESSFAVDIPEGESWTMNWLKHRIGEEMPDSDYRRGRAYTMINKYVSSAAHLSGKKIVSCEEMTDTYTVFNTSLENLKAGSDQSIISGINHSVFHGFNYSPPEAPFPGWIRYGCYYNENNNWWPHFHLLNEYKGRLSAILQNTEMYADIAIFPPIADMWSTIGAQNEPFPSVLRAEYLSLIWEAMARNGSGCDYISGRVIAVSNTADGYLSYGSRRYRSVFLVDVESLEPETAGKLLEFVMEGGRVFCIEACPMKAPGWYNHFVRDKEVAGIMDQMKTYRDRFVVLEKPENDFMGWYRNVQEQYVITPYLVIEKPDPYIMQSRHIADDGSQFIFFINSHLNKAHRTRIIFSDEIARGRYGWVWDPESGNKYRIKLSSDNGFDLDLGPAASIIFVFNLEKKGPEWHPLPSQGTDMTEISNGWSAEFRHCHDRSVKELMMDSLRDLKEMTDYVSFSGTIIYRNILDCRTTRGIVLNLGRVYGTSELKINGISCGVKWYGRRIYEIGDYLHQGKNDIEITVTTSMGNYMKSLTDNPIAQYWTNAGNKNQPLQSMGLIGPVIYYRL